MKKYIYLFASLLILFSCSKNEPADIDNPIVIVDNNKLLMLKIDYQTAVFEGGTELNFNSIGSNDTIPMNVIYNEPGDFGDILIEHIPTGDSIFFGTIVWAGSGERIFPSSLSDASSFDMAMEGMELPTNVLITYINENYYEFTEPIDFNQIWNAINELTIVQQYITDGAHIALLKYTPSVGIGDPDEWDWYVMLYQ